MYARLRRKVTGSNADNNWFRTEVEQRKPFAHLRNARPPTSHGIYFQTMPMIVTRQVHKLVE